MKKMLWLKVQPHKLFSYYALPDDQYVEKTKLFFQALISMQKGLDPLADEMILQHEEDYGKSSLGGQKSAEIRKISKGVDSPLQEGLKYKIRLDKNRIEKSSVEKESAERKNTANFQGKTIVERIERFDKQIRSNLPDGFPNSEIAKFISYWTEHGENDRKVRFEKEKTFDMKKRLIRWWDNVKAREKPQLNVGIASHLNGEWPSEAELRTLGYRYGLGEIAISKLLKQRSSVSFKWKNQIEMINEFKKFLISEGFNTEE